MSGSLMKQNERLFLNSNTIDLFRFNFDFKTSLQKADEIKTSFKNYVGFGIPFLDKLFGGIVDTDLVVLTAKTGGGKTEIASQIAQFNALAGKRVVYFALEGHQGEIELRIKYRMLASEFYALELWKKYDLKPNYQDWIMGKQEHIFSKYEPEINKMMENKYSNLKVYYRGSDFNLEMFSAFLMANFEQADIIILDQLSHIDSEEKNENTALKTIVRGIKDITALFRKPVILVVQMRKMDKKNSGLIPDIEEIYGTSEISKTATKIFIASPARDQQAKNNEYLTYFRAVKNRLDGSRCRFIGLCGFDINKNKYSNDYRIGELSFDETEVTLLDKLEYPAWAR